MVDIYPTRQVVNPPGKPLQVQVVNSTGGYQNFNVISGNFSAGVVYNLATVSTNELVQIAYAFNKSTTIYLHIQYKGSTYTYIINSAPLANTWYTFSFPVMSGATIGISVASDVSGIIYILY